MKSREADEEISHSGTEPWILYLDLLGGRDTETARQLARMFLDGIPGGRQVGVGRHVIRL